MRKFLPLFLIGLVSVMLHACKEEKKQQVSPNVQYLSGPDAVNYLRLGKEIADSVQARLKTNLTRAMQEGGPVHAVKFCNNRALQLTDSFSKQYLVEVKRTSDRYRNPRNAPDSLEKAVIDDLKKMAETGEPLSPKVSLDEEGRKHFFAPIFTGGLCLTCHGDPKNMQPELVYVLDSLYPNDKARGYAIDELRGIWSITFKSS